MQMVMTMITMMMVMMVMLLQALRLLPAFTAYGLSLLTYACAILEYRNVALLDGVATAMQVKLAAGGARERPGGGLQVGGGNGGGGADRPDQAFSVSSVTMMLWALVVLRHHPWPLFSAARKWAHHHLEDFNPTALTNLVSAP